MGRVQKGERNAREVSKDAEWRKEHLNQVVSLNCLEYARSLPHEILDCTITYPPVPIYDGESAEQRTPWNSSSPHNHLSWEDHVRDQSALLEELYRATKPGGHLWYVSSVKHEGTNFCHPINWLLRTPWRVRQEIIWLPYEKAVRNFKADPNRLIQKERRIYWLRKEPGPPFSLSSSVNRWGSVWCTPNTDDTRMNRADLDTFDIYLVLAIIHATKLPTGSLVFDPYGGSGTGSTAKACQVAKHNFLTTESNRLYNKMITDRLQQTSDEDKFWISLVSKRIAEETLDLSQSWDTQN